MIEPARLERFAADVLAACGVPREDAGLVAASLVDADMAGHQSHGLLRLPWYAARLRSGVMSAVTSPEVVVDAGAVAVLDGRDGVGQVVATRAAHEAIRRARAHGVAAVAVRRSNHFGAAGYFTRIAAEEGLVGMLASNASPAMVPWGGVRPAVGNNPWSVAAPAGRHGIAVLDLANTIVARGKIHLARLRGEAIPDGWAVDADGAPTTDPVLALAGSILPMGGHKGYAISFMVDVLAGVLTGADVSPHVDGPYQAERASGCGHLFLALDIGAFLAPDEFARRMEALIDELRAQPTREGVETILFPGEPEARSRGAARRDGVELAPGTIEALRRLAAETGLPAVA